MVWGVPRCRSARASSGDRGHRGVLGLLRSAGEKFLGGLIEHEALQGR